MKERDQIDDLFRSKLYDRDLQYDPGAWKEMKTLLDRKDKKWSFLFRNWKFFMGAIIFLTASVYMFRGRTETESGRPREKMESTAVTASTELTHHGIKSESADENKPSLGIENTEVERAVLQPATEKTNAYSETRKTEETSISPGIQDTEGNKDKGEPMATRKAYAQKTGHAGSEIPASPALATVSKRSPEIASPQKIQNWNSSSHGMVLTESASGIEEPKRTASNDLMAMKSIGLENLLLAGGEELMPIRQISHDDVKGIQGFTNSGWWLKGGMGYAGNASQEGASGSFQPAFFGGVYYERMIFNLVSADIGLEYSRRNAFGLEEDVSRIQFGFGYQSEKLKYDFRHLNFIEVPIQVHYFILPRHRVGMGIAYSYLFSTEYHITTLTESTVQDPSSAIKRSSGNSNAFVDHNFSLLFSYQYRMAERFRLGLTYSKGLNSVVDKKFFKGNAYYNDQLRLSVSYKLFR